MKAQFKVGDLVQFRHPAARTARAALEAETHDRYARAYAPWLNEIGLVVANDCVQGCVVSFPSAPTNKSVSTLSIEPAC